MPKKETKAKAAEKKARKAQKQEKKTSKSEKKLTSKKQKKTSADETDEEDVDLDAVLASYAKQQEIFLKITEAQSEAPTARSSATLTGSPANDNELFLFGGEYYNGALARFFNDLYVYKIKQDAWVQVTSPNAPLPRSGHAWTRAGNERAVYLFGGEFSSPKQGTFYHYNDFWRLEPSTREWSKVETKSKGPPARSGHRMTFYKQYVVLFGGFQDTSATTKYLADLWLYDTNNFTWHNPPLPPASAKPDARSSFTFLPHDSGAVMTGGYSRVKKEVRGSKQASLGKGGGQQHAVLVPVVHQDSWFLRIVPPDSTAAANAPPKVRWEMRKRPANAPQPARAGATMTWHKGRGIQFGGVHDVEDSEEGIDSEFFNTLYVWNVERNRFFPLGLRRARTGVARKVVERSRGQRGKKDEEELLANLARLEAKSSGKGEDDVDVGVSVKEDDSEEEQSKVEKPVVWEMPHARFNAQLTVQDDVLYIFGGTFEKDDGEFTFDEMWAVDLGKLDGCKEIFRRELEAWAGSDSEEEDDDEQDEDEDDDEVEGEDEDEAEEEEDKKSSDNAGDEANASPSKTQARMQSLSLEDEPGRPATPGSDLSGAAAVESEPQTSAMSDGLPYPRPFESLREFFARTSEQWQEVVLVSLRKAAGTNIVDGDWGGKSIKEVRKGAFDKAEEKWWDCREEIQQLEDEQEAAGIGEVVSLADKQASAGGASGAARRR